MPQSSEISRKLICAREITSGKKHTKGYGAQSVVDRHYARVRLGLYTSVRIYCTILWYNGTTTATFRIALWHTERERAGATTSSRTRTSAASSSIYVVGGQACATTNHVHGCSGQLQDTWTLLMLYTTYDISNEDKYRIHQLENLVYFPNPVLHMSQIEGPK